MAGGKAAQAILERRTGRTFPGVVAEQLTYSETGPGQFLKRCGPQVTGETQLVHHPDETGVGEPGLEIQDRPDRRGDPDALMDAHIVGGERACAMGVDARTATVRGSRDLKRRGPSDHPPERRSGDVTEHCVLPTGEHRGEGSGVSVLRHVTEGIDAGVHAEEPPEPHLTADPAGRDPELEQLGPGQVTELAVGERRDVSPQGVIATHLLSRAF